MTTTSGPVFLVAATVLAATAGCSSPEPEPAPPTSECVSAAGDLAVAVSGRRHSPAPRIDGDLRQLVADVVDAGHTVYLINVDGNPAVHAKFSYPDLPTNDSRAEVVDVAVTDIAAAVGSVRADDPEVNTLAAIALGADLVRPTHGSVVLFDNGASTTAPLDYSQPGVLSAEGADIAEFLTATGQAEDWSDAAVGFAALGAVTDPQPPLPAAAVTNLETTYTELARAFGARCSQIISVPVSATPVDSAQPVTLVPIPDLPTFHADTNVMPQPVVFDSTTVHFHPDSDRLVDPDGAARALQPVIDYLRTHPDTHATITGTCATGTGAGSNAITLSMQRAHTIARILLSAGVLPAQLTAVGVGTNFPEFVVDTDGAGRLLPAQAAQNRTVRIAFTQH